MRRPRPTLLLSGFMGTGKSTVGRIVAARAGVPFLDLDAAIEAQAGRSIEGIFRESGEHAFRALEAEALERALAGDRGEQGGGVVALGGGALLDRGKRRETLGRSFVATLSASPEVLAARTAGSARPLLAGAADPEARIRELLAARAEGYAEAHAQVTTEGRTPEETAAAVLEAWSWPAIAVPLGARSYVVRFAAGAPEVAAAEVAALGASAVFVVSDAHVDAIYGRTLDSALTAKGTPPRATVVLVPGEEHKRLAAVEQALTAMVEAGADRGAVVVGHGGGVVTDIAGFVAATLLRGVRWMGLPTTLLAMVDASVGGKTGVDLGPAKNAVGAFHQPRAVVIDVAKVATESDRAFRSGLAEVVKAGCIGDPGLFALLEDEAPRVLSRDPAIVEELAFRAVAVKAAIVARDEREAGERALLNFGHTVGHALEAEGGFTRLMHGEAVALGMVAMLRCGRALGVTDAREEARVVRLLDRLGLPVYLASQPLGAALRFVGLDKKRQGDAVRAVLMGRVGQTWVEPLRIEALRGLLGPSGKSD